EPPSERPEIARCVRGPARATAAAEESAAELQRSRAAYDYQAAVGRATKRAVRSTRRYNAPLRGATASTGLRRPSLGNRELWPLSIGRVRMTPVSSKRRRTWP